MVVIWPTWLTVCSQRPAMLAIKANAGVMVPVSTQLSVLGKHA